MEVGGQSHDTGQRRKACATERSTSIFYLLFAGSRRRGTEISHSSPPPVSAYPDPLIGLEARHELLSIVSDKRERERQVKVGCTALLLTSGALKSRRPWETRSPATATAARTTAMPPRPPLQASPVTLPAARVLTPSPTPTRSCLPPRSSQTPTPRPSRPALTHMPPSHRVRHTLALVP